MDALADPVERVAADTGFSGVVRVDRDGEVRLAKAYGLAHRRWAAANTVDTRFAIASGTKGLTTLTVVGLIEDGPPDLGYDRPDQRGGRDRSQARSFHHGAPRTTGPH
jgi:CubicO group peptidase (beta-lactamase class C family)